MSSNPPIPETEIEDWFSHPITQYYFEAIREIAETIHEGKKETFTPGDPFSTHEKFSWHLGAEWMAGQLLDMNTDKTIRRMDNE